MQILFFFNALTSFFSLILSPRSCETTTFERCNCCLCTFLYFLSFVTILAPVKVVIVSASRGLSLHASEMFSAHSRISEKFISLLVTIVLFNSRLAGVGLIFLCSGYRKTGRIGTIFLLFLL